jgi:DNA-binding MarR family transcriptional regulator
VDKCIDCLDKWVSIFHRKFQVYINKRFKEYNVSSSEFLYLMTLNEKDSLSQDQLSKELYIDKAAVARTLKNLEKKGLIVRTQDTKNYKIKRVSLSDSGNGLVPKLEEILDEWDSIMKKGVGEKAYSDVVDGIRKMTKIDL